MDLPLPQAQAAREDGVHGALAVEAPDDPAHVVRQGLEIVEYTSPVGGNETLDGSGGKAAE